MLLNIYDRILYSVSLVDFRKNLAVLGPLALGGACGIFSFSRLMAFLLAKYEMAMYFCFIGIIAGCIPMIYKRAKYDKIKPRNAAVFAASFAIMAALAFIDRGTLTNKTLAQLGGLSAALSLRIFFAVLASTVAMLLPGISGSLVMLLLGVYTVAIEAVSTFNFAVVAIAGAAVLCGGLIGVKLIKAMLRSHPQALYCGILGLITGSIFTIYPGFSADAQGAMSIFLMVLSAVLTFLFSKKAAQSV
ncbi:MAG: DUF368 domain-containing protein [Clostridiales bacterium]|nr:DUF368 domain-containing protein [Clostridiales bacterium]